jgi:hypothetical protein
LRVVQESRRPAFAFVMKIKTVLTTVSGQRIRLSEHPDQVVAIMRGAADPRRGAGILALTMLTGHGSAKRVLIPLTSVDTVQEA